MIGDKGVCVWDEANQQYVMLTNKVPAPAVAAVEVGIVKITDGAVGTCIAAAWNAYCVWPAKLQTPALGATLCGSPWADGIDVWVVDMRACSPPGSLKNTERFLAYNTQLTYEPDALGSRPLFVIKSDEQSLFVSPTAVIRIDSPSAEHCAPVVDDSNCLFYAVVQIAGGVSPNACSIWTDGSACYAVAVNVCQCVEIRPHKDERYLAYKISDAWGPVGDVRALYAFRHADVTRTAIVEVTSTESTCASRS